MRVSAGFLVTGLSGHGNTSCFDLTRGQPTRLECLDSVFTEGKFGCTLGVTSGATAMVLAVLDLAGHQHC
jgi:hypothetical protein